MALWDSGLWDTAKWSTVEATLSLTLDDVSVVATGQDVHAGPIAVTLGDISFASSGTVTHNGMASVTLADVTVAASGNIGWHGTLALTLDDVSVVATGQDVHAGPISLTLDDITFLATGAEGHQGSIDIGLADISFDAYGGPLQEFGYKGGIDKKKRKHVNQNAEIEKAVNSAVNKALGIEEDSEPEIIEAKEAKPLPDFKPAIEELMLDAEQKALQALLLQIELDELEDEETLLMLL